VEPLETIEQNNELVRLIEEEQAEIHRIFVALTRQVGGYAGRWWRARACWRWWIACRRGPALRANYDCVAPAITPEPAAPGRGPASAAGKASAPDRRP
jgi:DNA mismatch repair protein MutS2